jgi:hypothetical protein
MEGFLAFDNLIEYCANNAPVKNQSLCNQAIFATKVAVNSGFGNLELSTDFVKGLLCQPVPPIDLHCIFDNCEVLGFAWTPPFALFCHFFPSPGSQWLFADG